MKSIIQPLIVVCLALPGCAGSPPPVSSSPASASEPEGTSAAVAQAPDKAKARAHLERHVEYPADRAKILAACAETPEFTNTEKRWFEQHLPEGNYASAADVIAALAL